jgi:hypothetical protein
MALMAAATPPAGAPQLFNLRLVAGLIAAGILAFAAFMVLLAYAGDFRSGRDGRPHAMSVSAVGFKGLFDLIGYAGGTARYIRSEAGLDTEDLVIVAVEDRIKPEDLAKLLERRQAKPTLIILPKWSTAPDRLRPGWVHRAGRVSPGPLERLIGDIQPVRLRLTPGGGGTAIGHVWLDEVRVPVPPAAQTASGDNLQPLIALPNGGALLARLGEQPHYLLADPDLMNNQGLKDPRTARAALLMLRELNSTGAEGVSFDLTLNGFARQRSALKLAFEPPFLALTLALFVAALSVSGPSGATSGRSPSARRLSSRTAPAW